MDFGQTHVFVALWVRLEAPQILICLIALELGMTRLMRKAFGGVMNWKPHQVGCCFDAVLTFGHYR